MNRDEQKKIYENEIEPLVFALKEACKRVGMPMFTTVCTYVGDTPSKSKPGAPTVNSEYEHVYYTEMVTPHAVNAFMKTDKIAECIKVMVGIGQTNQEDVFDVDDFSIPDDFAD